MKVGIGLGSHETSRWTAGTFPRRSRKWSGNPAVSSRGAITNKRCQLTPHFESDSNFTSSKIAFSSGAWGFNHRRWQKRRVPVDLDPQTVSLHLQLACPKLQALNKTTL
jgi:hypothetical protein